MRHRLPLIILVGSLLVNAAPLCAQETPTPDPFIAAAAILEASCTSCHRPGKSKGGLDLTTRQALLKGGDNGAAAVPGKGKDSLVYRQVAHLEDPGMPKKADKLPSAKIAMLVAWIDAGAPYARTLAFTATVDGSADKEPAGGERVVTDEDRKHWAFRPLSHPTPPTVADDWARGDIDRFILAPLAAKGLRPAEPLPRAQLVRRLYFDLLGLPPTPEQTEAATKDAAGDWYERLVDQLLASEHFGERWGRHWLDLARYADSDGYEADGDRPGAWHYRDFVIKAFNSDLPFDRFVKLQLAGDELAPGDAEALAATGFCAAGPRIIFTAANEGTAEEREQIRYDQLDDIVTSTSAALLGLTVGCARCHDHKYDPLPTRDYYRLVATFAPSRSDGRSFIKTKDKEGSPEVAAEAQKPLHLSDSQATPVKAFLLGRGDPLKKREELGAGFLTVLSDDPAFARWLGRAKPTGVASTFQRAALAEWVCDVEHGAGRLLARVIVNRLWQHHLGEGLARTPSDVGHQGEAPSHPELLDWLAGELIANGWHLKPIHRLILTSATYRLGAGAAKASDGDDRLWRRRRPQRLEAEILRDSVLAVSGQLHPELYGPAVKAWIPPEARTGRDKDFLPRPKEDGPEQWRRSVYLFVKRSLPLPFTEVFDAPATSASCGRRLRSTVATQALTLMNDPFVRNQARLFAQRVRSEAGERPEARVERALALALARPPSADESRELVAFLGQGDGEARLVDLCHLLFTLNEFAYVD